ncbi:serine protease filzig [Prorops nasuta]|uniref:serine protease filzig n=1 Tax=Prorops nasuta TaxID=863751 RepID=UPI0034CD6964
MAPDKFIGLLILLIGLKHGLSLPQTSGGQGQSEGRKLFGGYRIVPKACQPTLPSRIKSNEPAICMFNYECSRRNGEVVGACMDGFLFGACCQLPSKHGQDDSTQLSIDELLHVHEIDHVPEVPILLNADGTPVGTQADNSLKNKVGETSSDNSDTSYTKISTLMPSSGSSSGSSSGLSSSMSDTIENAEKPQVQQLDLSHFEQDFSTLLGQQEILDNLQLPNLLSQQTNHKEQNHHDSVTTLLRPDQILQIADPVDQLPALFSHGITVNNHSSADTILLNENGTQLDETHGTDEFFQANGTPAPTKKVTSGFMDSKKKTTVAVERRKTTTVEPDQWVKFPDQSKPEKPTTFDKLPEVETPPITAPVQYMPADKLDKFSNERTTERTSIGSVKSSSVSIENTTPLTATSHVSKDDLVRVPTITYDVPSGNKKNDILDKEEIAINHIISILNNTTQSPENRVTVPKIPSPPQGWVSIDETSKPSAYKVSTSRSPSTTTESFPYTYYKPSKPDTFYNYELVSTENGHSTHSTSNPFSRPSTQTTYGPYSSFSYSARPTTNPPAPTVIVLGPLGTEYSTETTQKAITRLSSTPKPVVHKPSNVSTKKPSVSTTITHNISTVITSGTVSTNNNHVVSTSYISVNLKDPTSAKPSTGPEVASSNDQATKRPTVWTTISAWSGKPSLRPKPSTPNFSWPNDALSPINTIIIKNPNVDTEITTVTKTTLPACDDESPQQNDLVNFPPVRNPNLTVSDPGSQQEKPTLVEALNGTYYPTSIEISSDGDISTATLIGDESLTGNFVVPQDVVYNATTTVAAPTRKPSRKKPTRKPGTSTKPGTTLRPGQVTSKTTTRRPTGKPSRPASKPSKPSSKPSKPANKPSKPSNKPSRPTTKPNRPTSKPSRPVTQKPSSRPQKPGGTTRPKPTSVTVKRPQSSATTKKPRPSKRPTKRPTTTIPPSTAPVLYEATSPGTTIQPTVEEEASPTPDFRTQCGVRPLVKSGRIVGGKGATFGEWPWQVLVREATWLGLFTKNKCGGVLITDKYVITAAHCQPGFLASLVAVFGEFDISGELESKRSVTRNVRRVIVNRGYDPATFENDLALLELESPVQFDAHIVPICMPDDGADFTGRMATVTGWGRLKYNGGVPSVLQEVQVPIIKNSVCQEMFQTAGHSKLILDSFLCAGYANGQKDSCEGDSGGPLVMERPDGRWFLVGTVSHGIKCAAPYLPGVYMRTTFFKPWLHGITGV